MEDRTRSFIRGMPRSTPGEALAFARSVMEEKGVYTLAEMKTPEAAKEALFKKSVDLSEAMAFEKLDYALESVGSES